MKSFKGEAGLIIVGLGLLFFFPSILTILGNQAMIWIILIIILVYVLRK